MEYLKDPMEQTTQICDGLEYFQSLQRKVCEKKMFTKDESCEFTPISKIFCTYSGTEYIGHLEY